MRKLSEVRNCPYESFPAGAQDKSEDYVCMYVSRTEKPQDDRTVEFVWSLHQVIYCNMIEDRQVAEFISSGTRVVKSMCAYLKRPGRCCATGGPERN